MSTGTDDLSVNSPVAKKTETPLRVSQLIQIVEVLRMQEFAYPFLEPVDVVGLGLHDYNQLITEPMDLGTIKKRLETSYYSEAESVISDIQLVWRNAMKYNKKGSVIYNYAQSLEKEFNNMVKLAKKGLLLPGSQQDWCATCKLGGTLLCCDGGCGRGFHLHCVGLQEEPTDETWYCEDCLQRKDELDIEGADNNSTSTTTTTSSTITQPITNAISSESYAKVKYNVIIDEVESLADTQGRVIAELFLELPSKELYPDYYQIITNPISLAEIRERIDSYKSIDDFVNDFNLMIKNAQTYNLPKSLVFRDSQKLDKYFAKLLSAHFPQYAETIKKQTPIKKAVSTPTHSNVSMMEEDIDIGKDEPFTGVSTLISSNTNTLPYANVSTPNSASKREVAKGNKFNYYKEEAEEAENENEYSEEDEEEEEDEDGKRKRGSQPVKSEIPLVFEDKKVVEKILGDRIIEGSDPNAPEYEYYIKWKGKSYLHVSWIQGSVLGQTTVGRNRIKRYWQKKQEVNESQMLLNEEIEGNSFFNPELCEVDKIIARKDLIVSGETKSMYLVKWKNQNYTEATWERPEDIGDDQKINEFLKFNSKPFLPYRSPTALEVRSVKRWQQMVQSPPFRAGNKLRPYQLEGLNWLVFCWYEGRGSILADEMGLGKTIQAISFINYLHTRENIHGPFLIVSPLSTIGHWLREIEEWTDLDVVLYQGNKANRELCRNYEFYYSDNNGKPIDKQELKFNVLLTTYEMLLGDDWTELQNIKWRVLVTDEAQRLKNQSSKLLVRMKQFKSEHRILLTGTPIQNNTQELWSLLNFIEPNKFASINAFSQEFGQLKDAEQVTRLHAILRPHLLRRMKEDVEKSIPPKEETLVEVELTALQKLYYRAILERNRDFLNRGCTAKNVPNLINVVMQLRKVCNHPFLIKGVEEKETQFSSTEEYYEALISGSGKLVLLDKLLPKLKEGGHKVLIFSQMIKVLDLLESYLKYRGHLYERLDGGVRGNDRQASIDRFCKPGSDRFAFLLCTRAGGVGINLTSADTVIIYDSDWNPQNDIQAQARCHRIGQTQEVKVYRLISAKTYERHMFERSSKKLGLDQAVLHDMGAPTSMTTNSNPANPKSLLDKKNIDSLLKYGAYDLFKGGEDDKESEARFKEEDIDQILNRSSKVVWKEGTDGTQENQPSSSFSKATFTASTADSEIDVNDPNFWDLVLPEAKTAEKLLQKLEKGELSTREKRNSFLKDLSELVRDVVNGFKQGKFEEVARTRNILMQLFEAIKIDMSEFTEDQQTKLLTWGEEISRPSKRERKNTSRFGSSDVFFDEKGKKEKWTSKFKSKTKLRKGVPQAWKKWSEKERKLFHRAFMGYGLERWEDIKNKSGLPDAFEEEIREYAEEFIKQCIVHSDESDRDLYIKCLTAIMSPDQTLQLELRVDTEFKINKRRVKYWSKNLVMLQKIREALPDILDVDSLKDLVELPSVKKPLTTWWGPEEDRSLLIGVFKHGVGEYDAIKSDPELSFSNFSQEFAKKSSSSAHSNEESDDQAETEDQQQQQQQQENKISSAWPSSKVLDSHLMLLLDTLIKNYNTSQRQLARQQRVSSKQQSKRKIKEEREREWSKREQNEFRLALIMYGPFNWERVRISAGVRKTNEQMQEYYEYLLDECRKIIEEAIKRPQKRLTDKEEEDIEEEDEENEPAEKKQKLDSDYRESDKGIVSISMAKKILTRVTLFDDIKRALKHSQLKERLSSTIERTGPASWWCSPQHDEYLLHCVDKYGVGSEEWQILLENKQSPFYINDEGNLEYKKQKEAFLKEYTKDKTEFIRRLEYLIMVVLDPDSAKGSRRDRKRMWEGRAIVTRGSRGEGGEELMEQSLDLSSPNRMKLGLNFKLSTKDVARDEDGKPIVPFTAKGATILNLGTVVYDRSSFHSKNYIWPVGYKSSRKLPSIDKSSDYVSYCSEILDGGSAPIFKVTPSDKPHLAQTHNTSSGVWCEILKMIKKKQTVSVSGPEMFGFSDPLVKMLIQELPDARKCTSYQWKEFDSPYSNANEASTPIKSEPKKPKASKRKQRAPPRPEPVPVAPAPDLEDESEEEQQAMEVETKPIVPPPQPIVESKPVVTSPLPTSTITMADDEEDSDDDDDEPKYYSNYGASYYNNAPTTNENSEDE